LRAKSCGRSGREEMANQDFKEFFELLLDRKVEFLIIGGVAYNFYAPPRGTKDIDVWVAPDVDNCARLISALGAFGFPTEALDPAVMAVRDAVYILGKAPNRIDLLMHPGGVEWPDAWARRVPADFDQVPVAFLSMPDLVAMKRHAGRPQDLVDVAKLERLMRPDGR
jgi:hypothetical protein